MVGYAGGTAPHPTYRSMGDHTECVYVEYDPDKLTYSDLLAEFWRGHVPEGPGLKRQYMSLLFYGNEEEKRLAEASRAAAEARSLRPLPVEILPAGPFHPAEDYHQKYSLRMSREVLAELTAAYPDPAALRDSTAAARLNAWLGGHGTLADLERDLPRLGLSERAASALRAILRRR